MSDFGKTLQKSVNTMAENREEFKKNNAYEIRNPKKSTPTVEKIEALRVEEEPKKIEEKLLPQIATLPAQIEHYEEPNEIIEENQYAQSEPPIAEFVDDDNYPPDTATGICVTYLRHCLYQERMFKYGTPEYPRNSQTDQVVVQCLSTKPFCGEDFEPLLKEEVDSILSQYPPIQENLQEPYQE